MAHRFLRGARRVWALTALVATIAGIVITAVLLNVGPDGSRRSVAWWIIAVLFFVAEAHVVHVHFRGDAHSFSLSEIPLVLGLLFANPAALVVGQILGAGAALAVCRRQSAHKLAFNVAQFVLSTSCAILVFSAFGDRNPLEPSAWVAAMAATLIAGGVGVLAIVGAISVSQGRFVAEKLREVIALVSLGTVANTSLGLLAAAVLWIDPRASWLLLVPSAVLLVAYRAYLRERQKHESLQFIYESARILQRSPEIDDALMAVLGHACEMFRAETAETILFGSGQSATGLRCRVGPGGAMAMMEPVDLDPCDLHLASLGCRDATVVVASRERAATRQALEARGMTDAMIGPLQAEGRLLGVMVVGNRLGEVTTFDIEDLHLFETLAHHVSVALENGELERSLAQLRQLEEELKAQAFHDALTGLANRSLLTDRIEHALTRGAHGQVALLFIDLDDFKTVNDSLGHAAGDQLLIAVAQRIRGCIRPSDTAGRLGGDEFAVLLEDAGGLGEAMRVAERIIDALRTPFSVQETTVNVAASIGIALGIPGRSAADDLVSDADVAMYTAKASGKGTFEIFEPGMRAAVHQRLELKSELQRAIHRDEFVVHYQPVIEVSTGRVAGVEALVRWSRGNGTLVLPGDFVPLAEESGLIVEIGKKVLREACHDAIGWQTTGRGDGLTIAVNLSPRQLFHPTFVSDVVTQLEISGLAPSALVLEITESVLMHDTAANLTKLQELRHLGVRLAIDDFGTGFSSLSYLRRFPIDILKVAKPFVDALTEGESAFAEAIIRLGQSLGLEVVAEGIESEDQLRHLRRLRCDLGQGFLFSAAVDAEALGEILRANEDHTLAAALSS